MIVFIQEHIIYNIEPIIFKQISLQCRHTTKLFGSFIQTAVWITYLDVII